MLEKRTLRRIGAALVMCCALLGLAAPAMAKPSCLPASVQQKLAEIKQQFGPVKIVSWFRRGARIAGSGRRSYHASCRAVDFHPPPGKYNEVAAWLKKTHAGGVGTYSCGLHHIHLDNGPRVHFHKCGGGSHHASRRTGARSRKYAQKASGRQAWRTASSRKSRRYAAKSLGWGSRQYASSRTRRGYGSYVSGDRYAEPYPLRFRYN